MKKQDDKIILGIDPGTNLMGYGVIDAGEQKPGFLDMGVLDLKKGKNHYHKLRMIYDGTLDLIQRFQPDEVALEAPFYGKNVQSMLKLGRAQGVAMAAVLSRDIPVHEYAPRKIKLSITSAGDASKEQVAAMLARMFLIEVLPKNLDATDGLAVAVCHFYQQGVENGRNKGTRSWEEFVRRNPGRIR